MGAQSNNSESRSRYESIVSISGATPEELKQLRLINELPLVRRDPKDWIQIMTDNEWASHWENQLNLTISYIPTKSRIAYIRRSQCGNNLIYHVMYTIGFMFYIYDLTEPMQFEYNKVNSEYVDWYCVEGEVLKEEDYDYYDPESFAMDYAYYVLDSNYLLKETPKIYDWFKDRIFNGKTFPSIMDLFDTRSPHPTTIENNYMVIDVRLLHYIFAGKGDNYYPFGNQYIAN